MNSNVCRLSSDFSLFFEVLISKDTDTGTPTEAQRQTHLWPQSVFTHTVTATNAVHHPVPSSFGSPQGAPALLPASAYKWSDPCLNSFGWMVFVLFHTYGGSMLRAISNMPPGTGVGGNKWTCYCKYYCLVLCSVFPLWTCAKLVIYPFHMSHNIESDFSK